jgi:hypothetical protein
VWARRLRRLVGVRVLQARFYPHRERLFDFVVVGHVVWEDEADVGRPVVRPAAALVSGGSPGTVLAKLQYLVEVTAPGSFERLQTLRSRFWTFVEIAS